MLEENSRGRRNVASEEVSNNNRHKTFSRARKSLIRLINANADENSKFVTLTFAENVTDIDFADKQFENFIKRLNRRFPYLEMRIMYAGVREFQKRGAVHYHIVFFNLPYIKNDELRRIWRHGWVKINRIKHVDNLGAYVVKYMGKELRDDKLKGRKSYLCSKGNLERSTEIKEDERAHVLADALSSSGVSCYEATYDIVDDNGNVLNSVTYRQYNMKRLKNTLKHKALE